MSDTKTNEIIPKSFEDLIKEVHEKGFCGECGGCVSFCSADEIKAIEMPQSGPPKYFNKDHCLHCGICYLICPEIEVLNKELNEKYRFKPPIGNWSKIASVQATDPEIKNVATDGGAVTAILTALLENNAIDGALVSKRVNLFQREPFFATTKEQLLQAAGTYYEFKGPISNLEKYNTFVSTISELKHIGLLDNIKLAVVGVPCQIHSIRKMQELKIIPAHVVKYTLGLFCYENFKFDAEKRKIIEQKYDFSFDDIEKINIKENLIIKLKDKELPLNIEFSELSEIMRSACSVCKNFSNYYADISFGGLGSPNGFTTAMIRTKVGNEIYNLALKKNYINEPFDFNTSVEKSKILAKIISFTKMKERRAAETFRM
ncbi:MAG TPA: Coenzyme F420 hydrogenase/dehydrogenase, beta subunit C-terminal domain [Candidatus Lokiarchaeia archaeon]